MFRALFLQHFRKIYHTNGNEAAITLSADLKTEELFCQSHGSLKTIWRYHRSTVPLWNMVRLLMVSWACLNFLRKFLAEISFGLQQTGVVTWWKVTYNKDSQKHDFQPLHCLVADPKRCMLRFWPSGLSYHLLGFVYIYVYDTISAVSSYESYRQDRNMVAN